MSPIILDPSDSQEALVNAIEEASRQKVPLWLKPGTHLTKPGREQEIAIGKNGLHLTIVPESPQGSAVIKRPDVAINPKAPDFNYGLFFIPSAPTKAEVDGITWKTHLDNKGTPFEFGVIIRGKILIEGVSVDCNMHHQGLEALPKAAAEHSAMLGFAGKRYKKMMKPDGTMTPIPPRSAKVPRFVYVGFQSVALKNMTTLNGGYADDVWISRGYFNPNIERVIVEKFSSQNRVDPHRSTISFSAVCQSIRMKDVDIHELKMEETTKHHFDELPRQSEAFTPSKWTLTGIKAERIDLTAKGKVYVLKATNLTTTASFHLSQAGGTIRKSVLRVGKDKDRELNRLDDFVFDQVTWRLDPDENDKFLGLGPKAQSGEPCSVAFRRNVFHVTGDPKSGAIISSQYSSAVPGNRVIVSLTGCTYPESFGRSGDKPIANVRERGNWTFAEKDLGDRDPAVALKKGPQNDVVLTLV